MMEIKFFGRDGRWWTKQVFFILKNKCTVNDNVRKGIFVNFNTVEALKEFS